MIAAARTRVVVPLDGSIDVDFWSHVSKADGCWLWNLKPNQKGYGQFYIAGRRAVAHGVAWSLHNGQQVPPGQMVRHSCDTPLCCNPSHLLLGTAKQNAMDMMDRGRHAPVRRDALNESRVQAIRHLSATLTHKAIAERFGISQATVARIVAGKRWKHLTPPAPRTEAD